jgi:hypothetical protein
MLRHTQAKCEDSVSVVEGKPRANTAPVRSVGVSTLGTLQKGTAPAGRLLL